ncbi:Scramblase-domain-containing protein [Pleomassaria siparia CBS 279.74]|uniref:Scramblase-domain-containing protein n=1 Tax=Pleomassaria siparia CBS 279.74 TaxID=1314801 RepID=A0A6G1JR09_9PLEO|nr:Scramblase-domain-containing protein [Pleomassaria siparia CBS 279.74]
MLSTARWSVRLSRLPVRAFVTKSTPTPHRRVFHSQRTPPISSQKPPPPSDTSVQSQNVPPLSNPNEPSEANAAATEQPSRVEAVSTALATTPDAENSLVTPVYIPEDPNGVLKETHPVMKLLDNSTLVIQRQLELMNVLVGFEQANRYIIMDPHGNHIGYLAERDHGIGSTITRQMFKTHRSFTTHVFDKDEKEVLRFHRPFAWISSRIRVYDAVGSNENAYTSSIALQGTSPGSLDTQTSASVSSLPLSDMRIIGSAEQEWGLLRRKYNLFLARNLEDPSNAPQLASGDLPLSNSKALQVSEGDPREVGMVQFARVDEPFLSWDFSLMSEDRRLIGSVNRNFAGFAREIFTDMGVYALRMDSAGLATTTSEPNSIPDLSHEHQPGMTLDQRAVMLATAVSVDFDYFSRHSGGVGGGMWPLWMPWFGGEAAGGAAAGEAGAIGAAAGETGIASEVGAAARGVGAGEGAIAGAGSMAGYEAMRTRTNDQQNNIDDQSPQAGGDQSPFAPDEQSGGEDVWGQGNDPMGKDSNDDFWGGGGGGGGGGSSDGSGGGSSGGGGEAGGEGGGLLQNILDFFE